MISVQQYGGNPLRPFLLPSPGGALPSADWSPNALSLTCPETYTHFVRTHCGLGSDRSKLDTGLMSAERNGINLFFKESIGLPSQLLYWMCHWSTRMIVPSCPVSYDTGDGFAFPVARF